MTTAREAAHDVFTNATTAKDAVAAALVAGHGHALPTEWAEKLNAAAALLEETRMEITESNELNTPTPFAYTWQIAGNATHGETGLLSVAVGSAEGCSASCAFVAVHLCRPADGCCPAGCTPETDDDLILLIEE